MSCSAPFRNLAEHCALRLAMLYTYTQPIHFWSGCASLLYTYKESGVRINKTRKYDCNSHFSVTCLYKMDTTLQLHL